MSAHIPDRLLERFVAGDLAEPAAVEVALHIDECSSCAERASALEPLAEAFASAPDPVLPDDFHASVLAELERPQLPLLELGVGSTLLLVAVALMVFVDGPVRPVVDSFTVAHAVTFVVERVTATLSVGEQVAIVLLAVLGVGVTLRFATSRAPSLLGADRRTAE